MSTPTLSKHEIAAIYRAAAARIEEFGWVKGKAGDEKVGYCLVGAINSTGPVRRLADLIEQEIDQIQLRSTSLLDVVRDPTSRLSQLAEAQCEPAAYAARWMHQHLGVHTPVAFNDAPRRTKTEVIAILHRMADELDPPSVETPEPAEVLSR